MTEERDTPTPIPFDESATPEADRAPDLTQDAHEWTPETAAVDSEPAAELSGVSAEADSDEEDETSDVIVMADLLTAQTETSTEESTEAADEAPSFVAFVADPFQLGSASISEAQGSDEALVLDEPNDDEPEEALAASETTEASPDLAETEGDTDSDEVVEEGELLLSDAIESEADLARLTMAMAAEQERNAEEVQALAHDTEAEAAQRLAREIAEDEALAKQLADEQAGAEAAEEIDPELAAALPQLPTATAEDGTLDLAELESCIEALLFMTDKPMSTDKLRELLGPDFPNPVFQEAVTRLRDRYQKTHHGIELVEVAGGLQFRTKPGRAALAKKLAKVQTQRLSTGAMETLAIIAYRQPALKDEIDKVRGVDSSHFVRGLLDKKLIRISGRSELPGRPMLYGTTPEFLELFGLKDLSAMPSLRELEQMVPSSESKGVDEDDPRVKEMRRLVGEMKSDVSANLKFDPKEDEKILSEIRERVSAIPTSTPYIEEQKAAEKAAAEAAAAGVAPPPPGLEGFSV